MSLVEDDGSERSTSFKLRRHDRGRRYTTSMCDFSDLSEVPGGSARMLLNSSVALCAASGFSSTAALLQAECRGVRRLDPSVDDVRESPRAPARVAVQVTDYSEELHRRLSFALSAFDLTATEESEADDSASWDRGLALISGNNSRHSVSTSMNSAGSSPRMACGLRVNGFEAGSSCPDFPMFGRRLVPNDENGASSEDLEESDSSGEVYPNISQHRSEIEFMSTRPCDFGRNTRQLKVPSVAGHRSCPVSPYGQRRLQRLRERRNPGLFADRVSETASVCHTNGDTSFNTDVRRSHIVSGQSSGWDLSGSPAIHSKARAQGKDCTEDAGILQGAVARILVQRSTGFMASLLAPD